MKTIKIPGYEIRAIETNGKLSVTVLKNKIFKTGGLIKNDATDKEIKQFSRELITRSKKYTT